MSLILQVKKYFHSVGSQVFRQSQSHKPLNAALHRAEQFPMPVIECRDLQFSIPTKVDASLATMLPFFENVRPLFTASFRFHTAPPSVQYGPSSSTPVGGVKLTLTPGLL